MQEVFQAPLAQDARRAMPGHSPRPAVRAKIALPGIILRARVRRNARRARPGLILRVRVRRVAKSARPGIILRARVRRYARRAPKASTKLTKVKRVAVPVLMDRRLPI